MQYVPHTLTSGLEVFLRPRTYAEWEKQEEARLQELEAIPKLTKEKRLGEAEISMQRGGLVVRNARLSCWIKDFSGLKEKLTLRDIAEIEDAAIALETVEIPLGNSENGGSGQ